MPGILPSTLRAAGVKRRDALNIRGDYLTRMID